MKTRLLIADDHEILRNALAETAASSSSFDVVGCVGDAQSAVNACADKRPDILLLDLDMPGRDAIAAISDIRSVSPTTKVVVLTAYCRDAFIQLAVSSGVAGYLLKSDPPRAIFDAISKIASGGTAYSKPVALRISQCGFSRSSEAPGAARLAELTPRELEVLRYIGRGRDNEQMAREMCLSKRTVERHVARLMDAVAIRDRAGLMKLAYEHGIAG